MSLREDFITYIPGGEGACHAMRATREAPELGGM